MNHETTLPITLDRERLLRQKLIQYVYTTLSGNGSSTTSLTSEVRHEISELEWMEVIRIRHSESTFSYQ